MFDILIRNGIMADSKEQADVAVSDGQIVKIAPNIEGEAERTIDASGKLVSMGFIDTHVHADKALSEDRVPEDYKRDGYYTDRVRIARELKDTFTAEDVRDRAKRLFQMAVARGTTTLRTQVELDPIVDMATAEGVLAAMKDCASIIDVQTVSFPQEGWTDNELEMDCRPYVRKGLEMGLDYVGGNMNPNWPSDVRDQIDDVFALADEFGVGLDIHLDNIDNGAGYNLPYVARLTEERDLGGKVIVSHLTSLPFLAPNLRERSMQRAAEADVIACCPGNKHTPISDLMDHGVQVVIGTDNIRDIFTGLGNADVLGIAQFLARINGINRPGPLERLYTTFTSAAAEAMELGDTLGLAEGKQADLVVLDADSPAAAIRDVATRLYVIKRGKIVAERGELVG